MPTVKFTTVDSAGRQQRAFLDTSEVIACETYDLCDGSLPHLRIVSRYGRTIEFRFASARDRNAVALAVLPDWAVDP